MCGHVLLILGVVLALAAASEACVYKYGTSPGSEAPSVSGTSWDYKVMGDDWSGVDGHNKSWSCMSGLHQSPIDLPVSAHIGDPSLISKWSYPSLISNGSNIEVINNGHAIQVEWTSNYEGSMDIVADASPAATITDILSMPDTSEGTKVVTARPLQFHFHTGSEHFMDGDALAMEMHIVSRVPHSEMPGCPEAGCLTVTAVLFKVREGPCNAALKDLFTSLPMEEGTINFLSEGATIDLGKVLPSKEKRSYYQYAGSLTTPPCSEGLLWHVLDEASHISWKQYRALLMAVSDKDCTLKAEDTSKVPRASTGQMQYLRSSGSLQNLHRSHTAQRALRSSLSSSEGMPQYLEVVVSELKSLQRDRQGVLVLQSSAVRHLTAGSDLQKHKDTYVCVAYAYSQNRRLPQPSNDRMIKYFEASKESDMIAEAIKA
uniref:carbonic anhydrase n=1 Tax=Chlamydomonas sp. ICE-L TaxID=309537 RepID=A0A2P0ZWF9_9CHLO|nr:alpha-carbonic anhydrase 3 [Chlamydomonas sp. ICE-L]